MMDTRSESPKLIELRAKTDHQLAEYINNRLDAGLTYARLVMDPDTRSRWASTEVFHDNARKALDEARKLLPVLSGMGKTERAALRTKLDRLYQVINEISANAGICRRAACF